MSDAVKVWREDSKVRVTINVPDVGWDFYFTFDSGSEWASRLLTNAARSALFEAVKRIRSDAYEAGWKDAKAKRKKQTWFSGVMS